MRRTMTLPVTALILTVSAAPAVAQVAGWRGPVLGPGKVKTVRLDCAGFPRDVFATRGDRVLPERTLRRVHGTRHRYRNRSDRHVRLNAECIFPAVTV